MGFNIFGKFVIVNNLGRLSTPGRGTVHEFSYVFFFISIFVRHQPWSLTSFFYEVASLLYIIMYV